MTGNWRGGGAVKIIKNPNDFENCADVPMCADEKAVLHAVLYSVLRTDVRILV